MIKICFYSEFKSTYDVWHAYSYTFLDFIWIYPILNDF